MAWKYINKKTGQVVISPCVDSFYWDGDWDCEQDSKTAAMELIDQILELEKFTDADYVKLLAEKKIYRHGESAITFHLKVLKELVRKI